MHNAFNPIFLQLYFVKICLLSKDYLDLKDYFALCLRILYVFMSKDYMDLKTPVRRFLL